MLKTTVVRTSSTYPDGELIQLCIVDSGNRTIVTDEGEALKWVKMRLGSENYTSNEKHKIHGVCSALNVSIYKEQLYIELKPKDDMDDAKKRLTKLITHICSSVGT